MNLPEEPDQEAWDAWHPAELTRRLAGLSQPWCVVGGWALDLWLGNQTREHEDLEFTILRADFCRFRQALHGMAFYTADSGVVAHLPDHEEPADSIWQVWCRDEVEHSWRVDMMFEPGSPEIWAYKRDPLLIRPRAEMVATTEDGIPYLKPAGVLLFKAKHRRPKDEADFKSALPKLPTSERVWLRNSLAATHSGHDWIGML